MSASGMTAVLVLSPLVGFLINGLRYKKHPANLAGIIASACVFLSFASAIALFAQLLQMPEESRKITVEFFSWLEVDALRVPMAFVIDPLSSLMILIISGVGFLIHLFSIGYMHHDKGAAKYFSYLNLFIFNMLILVLGDSLLTMFVGWEGVGLCSYLLIGFWFTDEQKAAAGLKAFLTNRIGDAAFLLGLFLLFKAFGAISLADLNALAPKIPEASWMGAATLGTLLLFIGATGKSAQIPLYVWLPDAMAGPTPVSALIHAATMVTAGVYMIVRLNGLFSAAPLTLHVIAVVGGLTALLAATIGTTQFDIKKILAYSTVSQLGFMFLAAGVGAYTAAFFHLMTHAFFKALMFLGSGSVIHALHEEQDIRKMGGLKKYLPITYWTFTMGWLAIIGIPPFAGFFSKDEILWQAFSSDLGHPVLWTMGAVAAMFTAFYMTRLMALTFWGESRVSKKLHPHDAPPTMAIPLIVLAVLAMIGGWVGIPHVIAEVLPGHPTNLLGEWLKTVVPEHPHTETLGEHWEWGMMIFSTAAALAIAIITKQIYAKKPSVPENFVKKFPRLHKFIDNKYFVDEFYEKIILQPLVTFSKNLWNSIDVHVIDQTTHLLSDWAQNLGKWIRFIQSGNLQQYALYTVMGLVVLLSYVLLR